jgi:hypothetical protein
MQAVRPPLGLRPAWVHERDANSSRVQEICAAIVRYESEAKSIPQEWIDEMRRRITVQQ